MVKKEVRKVPLLQDVMIVNGQDLLHFFCLETRTLQVPMADQWDLLIYLIEIMYSCR